MGVSWDVAERSLDHAAVDLFVDQRVRSVGIGRHQNAYGYHVIRNTALPVPLSAMAGPPPTEVQSVPVVYNDRRADVVPHVKLPSSGPGSPGTASLVPEQQMIRPLVCGLQIENYDDDVRTGTIAGGHIIIGTLGCFVRLADSTLALLSNNHVVAGENRGVRGTDRILQQGTGSLTAAEHVGTLNDFVAVQESPATATPARGGVVFNDIDAGVASLIANMNHRQSYLPTRKVPAPSAPAAAVGVNEHVFKVGRTTGLTFGIVTSVATIVGPIPYAPGPCWFRRSIVVEGVNGTMFSDHGDSGSAVLKAGTGEVIGLLYAGNGTDTYVCPIATVLSGLKCDLI